MGTSQVPTPYGNIPATALARATDRQRSVYEHLEGTNIAYFRTVGGIASALNISKPIVSKAVDRFVRAGLAQKIPDPDDSRTFSVFLT